jgi:predicted metal-dependent phosphoesterase TrpH
MRLLKTVIHAHTNYSTDSNRSPLELVETARRQGVDCVAITDHDEIEGALLARTDGRVRVIVGQEVSTADGHLIGLFLEELVPPGRPAGETARRIHAQGGLVLAPHPFSTLCDDSLGSAMVELLPHLDAVEVSNAQNPLPWQDAQAARFAHRHGLPGYVGADAHLRGTLAACYQLMPDFQDAASFRTALLHAELFPGRLGVAYLAAMVCQSLYSNLLGRPLPGFGGNAATRPTLAPARQPAGV